MRFELVSAGWINTCPSATKGRKALGVERGAEARRMLQNDLMGETSLETSRSLKKLEAFIRLFLDAVKHLEWLSWRMT